MKNKQILSKQAKIIKRSLGTSLFFILKVDIAFSQNKIEKLNEKTKKLVEKTLNKENIPGISISISINDSLIFIFFFGYSNI